MEEKIKDIRNAVASGCFLSALALSLTLPDICAKVEFPCEKGKKAYINWFSAFVLPYYQGDNTFVDDRGINVYAGTEFDGAACYALRCAFLHSGNANLKKHNKDTKISQFDLCITSNKDSGVYVDKHGITTSNYTEKIYQVRLDVRKLCYSLCDAAEIYYKDHKHKELFIEHAIHIINMEEEMYRLKLNISRT